MQKCKRLVVFILLFLFLFPGDVVAGNFDVTAGAAILMEASTGQILYEKNADEPRPPASITKLMTLLLAFEALEREDVAWEDPVLISERAWSVRVEGSKMFLPLGEEVLFGDIVTGISVVSANDGCIAVAEHLYGSEEAFTLRMNQRAAELGMTNTTFRNSSGLPAEGHVMSARDIAILARYLITNHSKILELESMRSFTFNNMDPQPNRNPLLGTFPGADGLKTGWTPESGFSLAGTAEQNNIRMISVALNTASNTERLVVSQELLTHGFRNFQLIQAIPADSVIGELPVKDGKKLSTSVTVREDVWVVVPTGRGDELELVMIEGEELKAPAEAGTTAGTVEVRLDGETLASSELITMEDTPRANIFTRLLRFIGRLFSGLVTKIKDR